MAVCGLFSATSSSSPYCRIISLLKPSVSCFQHFFPTISYPSVIRFCFVPLAPKSGRYLRGERYTLHIYASRRCMLSTIRSLASILFSITTARFPSAIRISKSMIFHSLWSVLFGWTSHAHPSKYAKSSSVKTSLSA